MSKMVRPQDDLTAASQYARSLIEASLDPLVTISPEGTITDVNEATVKVTGVPRERLIGTDFCDYFIEKEKACEGYQQVFTTGLVTDYPLTIRHKDGHLTPVLYNASVYKDSRGSTLGVFAAARDITARKQAEETLATTIRALRSLSRCAQAMIHAENESTLLDEVCKIVVETGGYRFVWIGYAEQDERRTVRPIAWAGHEDGYLSSVTITWADDLHGRGPTGTAIRTKLPQVVRFIASNPDYALWRADALKRGYASSISLPLSHNGGVFGALMVYAEQPDAFAESEITLLQELAGDLSYGIVFLRERIARKQAEMKLRESSDYARNLIETSLDPLVTISPEGTITDVNEATIKVTGVSRKGLIGTDFCDYFTEKEKACEGYQQVFTKGLVTDYPLTIRHKDGHLTPVLYNASVYKDTQGHVLGVLAAARNVTVKNQVEAELRKSEQRYRALVTATTQIVWTTDPQGLVTDMPDWRDFTGQTLEEVKGAGWINALHPDDRNRTIAVWRESVARRSLYDTEYRVRRHDGVYRDLAARGVPVLDADGTIREWVGTCTDITERKRAEAEIRQLNAELEQRVAERTAQLDLAVATLKKDSDLIKTIHQSETEFIAAEFTAQNWEQLLDRALTLSESEYGFIDELFRTPEGAPYLVARAITDISWNEQTRVMYAQFLSGELRFTNPNSLYGAVMVTGKPVIANDAAHDPRRCGIPPGHPPLVSFLGLPLFSGHDMVGVIGLANRPGGYTEEFVKSIAPMVTACGNMLGAWRTEQRRKQAEANLLQSNSNLTRQAAALEALNHELEAFSYSVSHDLRAPLRSIDGFSLALLEDYLDKLDDQGRNYLRRVRAASQHMAELIDNLLTLSRVTRGEMRQEAVDLTALAQEIAEELQRTQPDRRVAFIIAERLAVTGDRGLLRQALANLLDNAWKFTAPHAHARIEVGATEHEGRPAYFVRDDGIGFDMAYAGKLFTPFHRLHSSAEFPGTGIGLATVQRIVHRHGGRVWAEGAVGRGATISFTLG